jgi:hypothetical protein
MWIFRPGSKQLPTGSARLTIESMKWICLLAICGIGAFAQANPSGQPPAASVPVDQANAQKAKALVSQAIQALGGEAYLQVHDLTQQGRSYSFHHGESTSAGIVFWRFYKYPDKERVEVTKQRDVIYVYNHDKGYEITYKGVRAAEDKDLSDYLRRRDFALDWVLRKWFNDPTVAFFYEGQATASQKTAEQVTLMNSQNQAVTLFLDVNSHLPIKKTFSWRDPVDKERNIEEDIYDGYRLVQGVMTPFSLTHFYNGDMSSQRFLNEVSYNHNLNDSMFEVQVTEGPVKIPRK